MTASSGSRSPGWIRLLGVVSTVIVVEVAALANGVPLVAALPAIGSGGGPAVWLLLANVHLNATPWSAPLATLRSRTGLEIVGGGPGAAGTWPTWLAMPRVHIDHVLLDRSIRVRSHRVGPDIGSDHLPVIVDLELPPRASETSRGVSRHE